MLAASKKLSFLRIGANAGDGKNAERAVKLVREAGLEAKYSIMKAYVCTPEELAAEAAMLESFGVQAITIMDSAGYMFPAQAAEYTKKLKEAVTIPVGFHVKSEWVTLGCGVVYGLATGVKAFTKPGDAILIQQPVYYPFREVIEDNGRRFINNQLHYENGKYTIDFDDFEKKIIDNDVKVFMMCSPHNPAGRVWTKEEMTRLGDICQKHQVLIMSFSVKYFACKNSGYKHASGTY